MLFRSEHKGQPTVILAKTIKGWTLGSHFEGLNSTHQMKKLTAEDLAGFRDRLYLDIPDEALDKTLPPYYKPDPNSDEMQYMFERRRQLGGAVPRRRAEFKTLKAPEDKAFDVLKRGSGKQEVATTMARSEEHTSELQSRQYLVCRLLLEKKTRTRL